MGYPTEDQVLQILERVKATLDEWDDCEYALCVMLPDGSACELHRISSESAIRVGRNLLNVSLDKIDAERAV